MRCGNIDKRSEKELRNKLRRRRWTKRERESYFEAKLSLRPRHSDNELSVLVCVMCVLPLRLSFHATPLPFKLTVLQSDQDHYHCDEGM